MKALYLFLSCVASLLFIVASAKVAPGASLGSCYSKKCEKKLFNFKAIFGFNSWAKGVVSVSTALDTFNGLAFLCAPAIARKAAGLNTAAVVPPSFTNLLGVAFLSAAAGKLTVLAKASEEGSDLVTSAYCGNALVPLAFLGVTLIRTPLLAADRTIALKAVAAPLAATTGLLYSNWRGFHESCTSTSANASTRASSTLKKATVTVKK